MKKQIVLVLLLWTANIITAFGQAQPVTANQNPVGRKIEVCYQKTSNIIFPAAIKSVDRGSGDILVQLPNGVDNVLKVKAARQGFPQTNLTVITGDGAFYSFTVDYAAAPASLVVQAAEQTPAAVSKSPAQFSHISDDRKELTAMAAHATVARRNIHHVKDKTYEVKAAISGLYTSGNLFLMRVVLNNTSSLDYEIQAIRLMVADKKQVKRAASQQLIVEPVDVTGKDEPVRSKSKRTIIISLSRQTISKDKHFVLEIVEKNGGRNLVLTLGNKTLLKAKPL